MTAVWTLIEPQTAAVMLQWDILSYPLGHTCLSVYSSVCACAGVSACVGGCESACMNVCACVFAYIRVCSCNNNKVAHSSMSTCVMFPNVCLSAA